MSIWKKPISVEQLTAAAPNTAVSHLGQLTEVGDDSLRGRVPVDERTRQPSGCCTVESAWCWLKPWAPWAPLCQP